MKSKKSLVEEDIELKEKYGNLKASLNKNENLQKEKKEHMEENKKLRKNIEILKLIAKKFTLNFQNLQSIVNNSKAIFNKTKLILIFFKNSNMLKIYL